MENRSYCYNCKNNTNNEQLFEAEELITKEILRRNESGDDLKKFYTIQLHEIYVYKCLGCGRLHIENRYKMTNEKEYSKVIYPKEMKFEIRNFVEELPIKYFRKIIEINRALNEEMYWLASFGIRTLIDEYITDIIGDIGGFDKKIQDMNVKGYITKHQMELLNTVIDSGNASAHRGYEPDEEILKQIMQIVYNIFESSILDRKSKSIKESTPSRKKKIKSK